MSHFRLIMRITVACCALAFSSFSTEVRADEPEFDLILRGGSLLDGSGTAAIQADIAVQSGRIAAIGGLAGRTADRDIDVTGRIVAPGFIDLHSHAEKGLTSDDALRRSAPNLVTQGITTVVVNQDGDGPESIREQRITMERLGIGLNVVQLVGHGQVRRAVMKDDHRRPATADEIAAMQKLVRQGLSEGAHGLSAGLEYVPGRWSTQREMELLVRELAPFEGVYIVHERSSGSRPMWYLPSRDNPSQPSMIDNLRELIDIGASTGVTVVATHIKARGVDFWASSRLMLNMIEQARKDGVSIFADQYPYNTSGSDGRIVLIPAWVNQVLGGDLKGPGQADVESDTERSPADILETALADKSLAAKIRRDIEFEIMRRGGADKILVIEHPSQKCVGRSLAELATIWKCTTTETAIRLQLQGDRSRRGGARVRAFSMSEADVEAFAATLWIGTSSDAGITLPTDDPVHPRFYGAFPRKIRRYAIERKRITISEAVRVSTSLPAKILNLPNRGTIAVGAHADIVVFDPQKIRDTATVFTPHQYCEGIDHVFISGRPVVENGRRLGTLAGRVIRRGGESTGPRDIDTQTH